MINGTNFSAWAMSSATGPHPNECCELLPANHAYIVMGNHDAGALRLLDTDHWNEWLASPSTGHDGNSQRIKMVYDNGNYQYLKAIFCHKTAASTCSGFSCFESGQNDVFGAQFRDGCWLLVFVRSYFPYAADAVVERASSDGAHRKKREEEREVIVVRITIKKKLREEEGIYSYRQSAANEFSSEYLVRTDAALPSSQFETYAINIARAESRLFPSSVSFEGANVKLATPGASGEALRGQFSQISLPKLRGQLMIEAEDALLFRPWLLFMCARRSGDVTEGC